MLQRCQSAAVTHLSTGNTRTKPRAEQNLGTVAVSASVYAQEYRALRRAELKVERTCDVHSNQRHEDRPWTAPEVLESGT